MITGTIKHPAPLPRIGERVQLIRKLKVGDVVTSKGNTNMVLNTMDEPYIEVDTFFFQVAGVEQDEVGMPLTAFLPIMPLAWFRPDEDGSEKTETREEVKCVNQRWRALC